MNHMFHLGSTSWGMTTVIFTGGGILGQPLLETARVGILNCHAGILPKYRGMDVIEWPVLLGNQIDTDDCAFYGSGIWMKVIL